ANPHSILGVSKRIAELAVLGCGVSAGRYAAIRLVNVLGSNGSVLPLFLEQIKHRRPLTITHPEAARHFIALQDAVHLILTATALDERSVIYVPEVSEPIRIVDIARQLLQHTGQEKRPDSVEFTGLRPGEKLREELLAPEESFQATSHHSIKAITESPHSRDKLDQAIRQLDGAIKRRDLSSLLRTIRQLVPGYKPSKTVCPTGFDLHD
ncbi:MAG TPA: polysaccharide biosynthesis protein, partial [Candidatus Sulfotelmatobacter sp.]